MADTSTAALVPRVFSGIQPTGRKHLGNYLGAIRHFPAAQERGEAIFCIVDLHAITVAHDPRELAERTYDTAALMLAAGLSPERCILSRQADVPQHTELCWLLASVTPLGELQRMHHFRDKSSQQRQLVSAALLFYPVLMAADILAYRATEVPVGEDQREHLELARDIAQRFNKRFGDGTLVVPTQRTPPIAARVKDLQQPTHSMSTTRSSEGGAVRILDTPDVIRRKFRHAVTDPGGEIRADPSKPGVTNLLEILAALREVSVEAVEESLSSAHGYGKLKEAVAEAVIAELAPLQERYAELRADEPALDTVLARGAKYASEIARRTVADVRQRLGVGRPHTRSPSPEELA